MSGTRKMEKFELDAHTQKSRSPDDEPPPPPPPSRKQEQDAPEAAAAIVDIPPNALDDALGVGVDLPARTFDQRREPAVASAELPSVPFEARKPPTMIEPNDLPPVPFAENNLPSPPFEPGTDETPSMKARAAAASDEAARQPTWEPGEWVPPQSAAAEGAAGAAAGAGGAAPTSGGPDALRTKLAQKFVTLADSVGDSFREFAIGAGAWAVELTAPQGMSTGGGKQALQHLRLRPRREGYSVLVAGAVNQIEKRAELRDFDHVTILHEVRYRNALEVSRQEWEQFLRKAEVVLNAAGIQSMRTPPPRDLLEQRRNMQRISKGAVVALIVVLALAIVVVWRVVVALSAQQ